ncbi:MAG: transposase, partial [Cyanobacteria bacterium J06560_2]
VNRTNHLNSYAVYHTGPASQSGLFSKPRRQFLITVFATIYVVCGKVNFTNLSRYSELSERTYRRHFDEPYAFMGLNRETIALAIAPTHVQVSAIDASFVPKSGKATYGLDAFHNGKAGRSERGLEISMIAVVDVDSTIGYTLSVQQTPVIEKASERTRVDAYLDHLRSTAAALPVAVRHLVGDGFYSKRKWVDGVLEVGLEAIGKLRHDANLKYLYDGPQKKKGARRKYDGKVNLAERSRWRAHGKVDPEVDTYLYNAIVWSVSLKRKIQVVYLINCKHPERPCFALLFSTDLELDPVQLYRAYKARFQVEMCQPQYPHKQLAAAAEVVYLKAGFWAFIFSYKVRNRLLSFTSACFRGPGDVRSAPFPVQAQNFACRALSMRAQSF